MVDTLRHQDDASAIAYQWALRSFAVREGRHGQAIVPAVAQFSAWLDCHGTSVAMTSDGIGTKIEVAERLGQFGSLGFDLVAMVTDDLAANGVEPVALTNTLDVDKLDALVVDTLMAGLHAAALRARVAVVGGEIAELGNRVGGWGLGMHCNWCATAIGLLRPGWHPIDGSALAVGDAIIALQSTSFRSNGYTLLRQVLDRQFGDNWHTETFGDRTWGQWLLDPCQIYAPVVVALRESAFELHGLAHITGGGIPNKLGRILKAKRVGAQLSNLFAPTPAMVEAQRLGEIADRDAYRNWNMGNGFLLVVPPEDALRVVQFAEGAGYPAQIAGQIVAEHEIEIATATGVLTFPVA